MCGIVPGRMSVRCRVCVFPTYRSLGSIQWFLGEVVCLLPTWRMSDLLGSAMHFRSPLFSYLVSVHRFFRHSVKLYDVVLILELSDRGVYDLSVVPAGLISDTGVAIGPPRYVTQVPRGALNTLLSFVCISAITCNLYPRYPHLL